jgi:hypothetical protein
MRVCGFSCGEMVVMGVRWKVRVVVGQSQGVRLPCVGGEVGVFFCLSGQLLVGGRVGAIFRGGVETGVSCGAVYVLGGLRLLAGGRV